MMREWLPIEKCPIGHYVLLWCDGFCVIGYQFKRGKFSEHHTRQRHEIFHITHWMALPPGPAGAMNENMDAAPRDGSLLKLRLADGDHARGRFEAPPGNLGYWIGVDGRVLIPRPVAWSQTTD